MDPFQGKFYIGRDVDPRTQKTSDRPTLYDPDDLTTHGVVVGMTGSGKTGLSIGLIEEAALNQIPALLIDPKGDLANLLLHFPGLAAEDFQPWVDADQARREGKTVEQLATETAEAWRKGLSEWGIPSDRIQRVRDAVEYTVYTPGSDAGLPVSILASLRAPSSGQDVTREATRERIATTVTAILGLLGIAADPVRSREHILLSNIFEHFWGDGRDLDLSELIRQVQTPPFDRLGAFAVDQFYPQGERFQLAMALNSLLASPAFHAWMEGTPLEVGTLLWTADGRPRQSVFYLAHLSDTERMFFVTLLLAAVEAWVRTQAGSPSLRALLYFDEVQGYLPPVAEPSSKAPLMRLLKQARAFGFGVLLATQNPVDLDYKALSNAGTWFIGRMQTEQDKSRLLDGLEGVNSGGGAFDRQGVDRLISSLGKRVFLLHNVHEKEPRLFQTRWSMAYLRGPITRAQVPALSALVGTPAAGSAADASAESAQVREIASPRRLSPEAAVKPTLPAGIQEYSLPNDLSVAEAIKAAGRQSGETGSHSLLYRPALLAQASVRYLDRKAHMDFEQTTAALVVAPDRRGIVRWEEAIAQPVESTSLDRAPAPDARYADLPAPLSDAPLLKRLEKDFLDFVYRRAELRLPSNPDLGLVAKPGVTAAEFRAQCADSARARRDGEAGELKAKYQQKIKTLQTKLTKEERELAEDQAELSARKMEELATHGENLLGLFGGSRGRRRISTSLTKRRLTEHAKADVDESVDAIAAFKRELTQLEGEMASEAAALDERWGVAASNIEEVTYRPLKKDVLLDLFGVAWLPVWQTSSGASQDELPAYSGSV